MQRRIFIRNTVLASGGLLLLNAHAVGNSMQHPYTIKMLNDRMGVFTEKGGTILFYYDSEGIIVVDTQFPEQSNHLLAALKEKTGKPVQMLINTHHHGDHSGGNIVFKPLTDKLLAHDNSLKNQQRVAIEQKSEDKQYYPTITYKDKWSGKVGKESISMWYFGPAHTNGDSLVHFEQANIVHMGDLINNRRYPYIDRTAGASVKGWIQVLEKTLKTFDSKTVFVFGHASEGFPVYGDKSDISAMKDYFEKLVRFTELSVKSGKSREEFIKISSIPGVTEWVGTGIERSLSACYDELTGVQ